MAYQQTGSAAGGTSPRARRLRCADLLHSRRAIVLSCLADIDIASAVHACYTRSRAGISPSACGCLTAVPAGRSAGDTLPGAESSAECRDRNRSQPAVPRGCSARQRPRHLPARPPRPRRAVAPGGWQHTVLRGHSGRRTRPGHTARESGQSWFGPATSDSEATMRLCRYATCAAPMPPARRGADERAAPRERILQPTLQSRRPQPAASIWGPLGVPRPPLCECAHVGRLRWLEALRGVGQGLGRDAVRVRGTGTEPEAPPGIFRGAPALRRGAAGGVAGADEAPRRARHMSMPVNEMGAEVLAGVARVAAPRGGMASGLTATSVIAPGGMSPHAGAWARGPLAGHRRPPGRLAWASTGWGPPNAQKAGMISLAVGTKSPGPGRPHRS